MSFLQRRSKGKPTRDIADPVSVPAGHPRHKEAAPSPTELVPPPLPKPPQQAAQPVVTYRTAVSVADVTAVIVNFKTLWLARQAHSSLLCYYDVPVVLVDNGSGDKATTQWVQAHGGICNEQNIGHGPALNQAIRERVKTPFVLTLDSDCVVQKGGWLEEMVDFFFGSKAYAIGWLRWVDRWSGVPLERHLDKPPADRFVRYIHPAVGLYDVEKYKTLRPFAQLGAPCLWNMIDAEAAGYVVKDYPVFDYVKHLVAGTRRMYGGRWNPETLEKPGEWRARDNHPI